MALDYPSAGCRRLFSKPLLPTFPYFEAQLLALAGQLVRSHLIITGVQPKLSLTLAATNDAGPLTHSTIVSVLGVYKLKLPTPRPAAPGRKHPGLRRPAYRPQNG